MFGVDTTMLLVIALAAIAAGGFAYAVLFPTFETQRKSETRIERVKTAETDINALRKARDRVKEVNMRRKSVQESLQDLEDKQKKRENPASPPIRVALKQAGWKISVGQFYMLSFICGLVLAALTLVFNGSLLISAGMLVVGTLGVPRWVVSWVRARRIKAFINEFPNALDVMVRSIKSGLPLNDALRLIASDAQEPLRGEFRKVVEAQQLGVSVPESCERLYENVPVPETNFFAIVVAIQSQAGGNLSEALGNLSRVLRDRRKMKGKVNALSMEAKASAAIIGSLPFIIMFLVYLTTPEYIMLLFTDPRGNLILGVSAVWMTIGVLVMRNMINFDI